MTEPDLDGLYQELLLDHFRHPRHRAALRAGESLADGENRNCGDTVSIALEVRDGRVAHPRFDGSGCALSIASASMLCDYAEGRPAAEVLSGIDAFVAAIRGGRPPGEDASDSLRALAGVGRYPLRVPCATMSWVAMRKALERLAG